MRAFGGSGPRARTARGLYYYFIYRLFNFLIYVSRLAGSTAADDDKSTKPLRVGRRAGRNLGVGLGMGRQCDMSRPWPPEFGANVTTSPKTINFSRPLGAADVKKKGSTCSAMPMAQSMVESDADGRLGVRRLGVRRFGWRRAASGPPECSSDVAASSTAPAPPRFRVT